MTEEYFTEWAFNHDWLLVHIENPPESTHEWHTWVTPTGTVVYVHYINDTIVGTVQGVMVED